MVNQGKHSLNSLILSFEPLLRVAGIEEPRRELLQLLSNLLQEPMARLLTRLDDSLTPQQTEAFTKLAERRAAREPLSYITGTVYFAGLELAVGPGVLVPRPDSEVLVEKAVELAQEIYADKKARQTEEANLNLLDTCTGSGAIGIAIARQLKDAGIPVLLHLLDQSPEALDYARRNSERWCSDLPVLIELGDLFPAEPLVFDFITANPPYIADSVLPELMPEVSCYEPALALTAGPDGLHFYRLILERIDRFLQTGGWLLMEHGYDQARSVADLISASGKFGDPLLLKDYGGNPRVAAARRLSSWTASNPQSRIELA